MPALKMAAVTTPARMSITLGMPFLVRASRYEHSTPMMAKTKASTWIHGELMSLITTMASAAPKPAAAEIPRMSGETMGLRKTPW